jgi:aminomethyltransferase
VSALEEHLATRNAAGLFDFSFMGLCQFDDKAELQPLQTRNLDALKPGQIAYTLLLKDDGAVDIDATVWRLDRKRFWLFTGRRRHYGGRDASGAFAILALQGPASGWILARLVGPDAVARLRYFRFDERKEMPGLIVARLGISGELGYELLVPAAQAAALRDRLLELGRSDDLRECGWAAADSLRIESGYVLFDREVDGVANPRELGLERFISHSATTYPLRKRLVGLEILDQPGRAGLPAAKVTSECFSPTLGKTIALGFTGPDVANGSAVQLSDGRIARISGLPFYDQHRRRPRSNPV